MDSLSYIDTHTGYIFASGAKIKKLGSDLDGICAKLELYIFTHVKEIASIVGQIIFITSSCRNVSQIMTRYLHHIINCRSSWNPLFLSMIKEERNLTFGRAI